MKPTSITVFVVSAAIICDGAISGQREHADPAKPEPSVTKVVNHIEQTLWYRQPDISLLAPSRTVSAITTIENVSGEGGKNLYDNV
jgi:hypothetical protein